VDVDLAKVDNAQLSPRPPLLCFVGRFCKAKGRAALYQLIDHLDRYPPIELLFLIPRGAISDVDREKLRALTERHRCLRVINDYDQALTELIFAASDYVLMPSEQEPGGLCQKMAMRFGCLPIVTPVGGLKDSVVDLFADPKRGNGFMAADASPESVLALLDVILALSPATPALYRGRRNAMTTDVSWLPTIQLYEDIYRACSS
jgi:starch synthase